MAKTHSASVPAPVSAGEKPVDPCGIVVVRDSRNTFRVESAGMGYSTASTLVRPSPQQLAYPVKSSQ